MVVRIAPPGGRTRRRGGAVSLSGGDVPLAQPARDPGVNVPLIPIPVDETAGAIGEGLQDLGDVGVEAANLGLQVIRRDEGIARGADDTAFADFGQDLVRDLQKAGTLSDSAVVEGAGDQLLQEQERILSEHRGGNTSRALLENSLTKQRNRFADTLSVLNINAADVQLNLTVKSRVSSIIQEVLSDPDVLVSDDPMEAFRFYSGQVNEMMDFLQLNPAQRRVVGPTGKAQVALSMIDPLIRNKQFDRAITILRSEEVGAVMSPGDQRDAIRRIIDAERKLAEVKNEGQEFLDTARTILGATATDEDVRAAAAQMAGMELDGGFKIVDVGGGRVIAVDEDTLEVQTLVSGPTIEEDAKREKALTIARLMGKKEVLSSMAEEAGLGPLFGVPSTKGEGEKSKPAQPTSTEEEGEPTSPEVVPPISEEAISLPFGSDQPPVSNDMQTVIGLMAFSRRLLLIEDNAGGNAMLAQARMIIDNSREIQAAKELDKPITSVELLRELGLPLGSTMRQAVNRILLTTGEQQLRKQAGERISLELARENQVPASTTFGQLDAIQADRERSRGGTGEGTGVPRTIEDITRTRAIAGKRGRDQVDAEEQLAFVGEAQVQIKTLLEELIEDPTLVGAIGSFRATGRSGITLLQDLGMDDFISSVSELAFNAETNETTGETGFELTLDLFENPTLSSLDIIEHSIGVIIARLSTPAGRIPVELIRRSIKLVGLKGLRGSQVIIDRLNFVNDRMLQPRVNSITKRFPELLEPEETGAFEEQVIPSDTPRFRFEGGTLVPISPDRAPGGGSSESPFRGGSEGVDELRGEATNLSLGSRGILKSVKIKKGVKSEGTQPEILSAIEKANKVYSDLGSELVITSLGEGKHKKGSLHPKGMAVDLRTRDLSKANQKAAVVRLKETLGSDYDVVLEKNHIHVEFDPPKKKTS